VKKKDETQSRNWGSGNRGHGSGGGTKRGRTYQGGKNFQGVFEKVGLHKGDQSEQKKWDRKNVMVGPNKNSAEREDARALGGEEGREPSKTVTKSEVKRSHSGA